MAERKQVDWESVERDYSAGLLSLREIGDKHNVAHQVIARKAKKEEWARDLREKIAKAVDKKIGDKQVGDSLGDSKKASEKEIIEVNAQAIVNIKLAHRGDIRKSKRIVNALFDELELTTDNRELFEQLGELLRQESESGHDKLNDIYKKCISMPHRIDGVKKLTDALKTMIGLEREAYDIQSTPTPIDNAVSSLLKAVQGSYISVATSNVDFDDDE
ncbi:hypothetical protein [uncultured Agitococcus sp.]|uniref:hypothetical protein n=1 Tax=uncultured Agitococcus sp. TaxID=1506599 RepID=UPI00261E99B8|nr:hypothetical protein [uncultured Agitococcus sp.]